MIVTLLISLLVFSAVMMLLVVLLLFLRSKLVRQGKVAISINDVFIIYII